MYNKKGYYKKKKYHKKNTVELISESVIGFGVLFICYKFFKEPDNINNFANNSSTLVKKLLTFIIGVIIVLSIVNFLYTKKKERDYLMSGISKIDRFSGIEFENLLAVHFKKLGYKVKMTPKTNDYGADLVLYKDGECIVVQAKRYKNKVGISAIQQIVAAKDYYKASKTIVATNSYFTKQAISLAKECNVTLIDREKLIKIINNQHK